MFGLWLGVWLALGQGSELRVRASICPSESSIKRVKVNRVIVELE